MSSIYNSDRKIEQFFLGSQEITEMFLGNELVFSKITNNLFYKLHEFVGSLTVQNTIEAPVKSAILKGTTLVNCLDMSLVTTSEKASKSSDGTITINNKTDFSRFNVYNNQTLIPSSSTKQFILFFHNVVGDMSALSMDVNGLSVDIKDNKYIIFKTRTVDSSNRLFWVQKHRDKSATTDTVSFKVTILEYQEGMENWDIPYFEGMQSVKMPVLTTLTNYSNLFFTQTPINFYSWSVISFDTFIKAKIYVKADYTVPNTLRLNVVQNINGTNKENIYTNNAIKNGVNVEIENVQYIGFHDQVNGIKGEENGKLLELIESGKLEIIISDKTNILTVNEDVTLRSNGDVYDELNLLTGRLTQRIDENNEVLAQAVVKTVDLSSNKVYAYNGTTHYTCSSEEGSLIPTACIEVPVKTETVE